MTGIPVPAATWSESPDPTPSLGWDASTLAGAGASCLADLYTSAEVHRREQEAVFARAWHLVASTEEIPAGGRLALTVGPCPVLLWRDPTATLRAFHNLCPHRGLPVTEEGAGELGRYLVCPYHQWSFAADGTLANVPQPGQFPGLAPGDPGLRPVAVAEWHGMVFVSTGPAPEPFEAGIAPLADRLTDYFGAGLVDVATARYTVACNWKFLVENHIDVYHLWYLHQHSLRAYEHRSFRWDWTGRTWWSWEPLRDRAAAGESLPGLSEHHRIGIGAHLLYPNLMVIHGPRYLATYDARPLAPDRTAVTLRVRSRPGADGPALVRLVEGFLSEDIRACEQLQVGVGSPAWSIGALASDHEAPLGLFHDLLRRDLLAGPPGR